MNNLNNNRRSPDTAGVMYSLKKLAVRHRKKLVVTFFLVVAENVMFLLYPVWQASRLMPFLRVRHLTPHCTD